MLSLLPQLAEVQHVGDLGRYQVLRGGQADSPNWCRVHPVGPGDCCLGLGNLYFLYSNVGAKRVFRTHRSGRLRSGPTARGHLDVFPAIPRRWGDSYAFLYQGWLQDRLVRPEDSPNWSRVRPMNREDCHHCRLRMVFHQDLLLDRLV